jgi:hypothetical protein
MVMVALVAPNWFREPCVGAAGLIDVLNVVSIYLSGHALNERFIGLLVRGQMAKHFCCRVHRSVDSVSAQSIVMFREPGWEAANGRRQAEQAWHASGWDC